MRAVLAIVAVAAAVVLLSSSLACSSSGPPKKALFAGKEFKRGTIAREGTHQSFLYTLPEEGLAQNSRLGVIASSNETPQQLQAWIMMSYRGAMGNGRVLEEEPAPTTACKVGFYGDRDFIGLHVCASDAGTKMSACLELDERLKARVTSRDAATSLCNEYRAKHEAELKGLLPVILAKI